MQWVAGVEKCITFTTRDFIADSWRKDATDFRIMLRCPTSGGIPANVREWFEKHLFDNHRKAFTPEEEDPACAYLQCHDETEALSIITALQRELNEALT